MSFDIIVRIAGEGGEGIISAGDLLMRAFAGIGFEVLTFKTFPAEIKGGYALSQVRISNKSILSHGDAFNILIALNQEALDVNANLITKDTILIYDSVPYSDEYVNNLKCRYVYPFSMSYIAKKEIKSYLSKNMLALGFFFGLFDIDSLKLKELIRIKFKKYDDEVININIKALDYAIEFSKTNFERQNKYNFPKLDNNSDSILLEGNQAIALGAAIAGCRYYAAYPITPASSIANYFSELALTLKGFVYQNEDEISALASCLGASFGGVKSFTATSGPGLSLMTELIGLAIMTEIPVVIGDVQRGGPSTGMPTKHDQSDLFMACFASHGDAPRIVLAPSNVEENFYLIIEAFNLAEKYQTPVIFLSDASLSLRVERIKKPDISKISILDRMKDSGNSSDYLRYKDTENGISAMSIPGFSKNVYVATGLEHGEGSEPRTSEETRIKMTKKRWRKFENIEDEWHKLEKIGSDDAPLGIITWGLSQSICKEAAFNLRNKGFNIKEIYPKMLWPLPKKQLKAFCKMATTIFIPEANYQGQFAQLIKANIGFNDKIVEYKIYRGTPFTVKEIENKIIELYNKLVYV